MKVIGVLTRLNRTSVGLKFEDLAAYWRERWLASIEPAWD